MSTVNGIKGNGKVLFEGPRNPATHLQMVRLLGLRATPAARERLQAYIQTGKKPARLITLFERTCASLHLELGKFTEQAFVERFANWRIEGLDKDVNLNSPDYQIRFLLERVFNCGLAYHNESGLAMVSSEERDDIAKGDAEGYQLACPFAAKPQIIAPPISAPLPRITLTRRVVALVKHLAQPLAEKRSYSEQLRQRILFHVTEGHFRSAAFLLFRDKTAREILAFVRKKNLAERITSSEWTALLRIGIRPDIDYSAPSEEIAIGFLLAEAHPVISAYFIEDLAKSDPHSAARILGLVGQTTRSVEVAEAGDLISDVERSLAGYVLSAMLIRGQEKLANRVVVGGMQDPIFRGTYERVLAEMNVDFDENIATADKYDGSSLFRAGSVFFREVGGEGSTAIIKVKDGPYGWGGEELLSPRLFYRNLARKLIEGEGYDLAWEMMTCGRPAEEAFNDLNSALDPASFGRLLATRGRDEIARFVVEVLAGGEEYIEALAYVLRDTHEDIRDVAGLFEYLIEADGEIAGSREAAYAILYYAATAIENPSMAPLLDRYQEILVQIEQNKESAGWFNADVFLKEGRFLPTDPPSKIRGERLKFYFDLLKDTARAEEDRIYAARMLGRMGAIEYLDPLRKLIIVELKAKRYNATLMTIVKIYFNLCEELDLSKPDHQTLHKRAARFLKKIRDRLVDLFTDDIAAGKNVLILNGEAERNEEAKRKTTERASLGRDAEINSLWEIVRSFQLLDKSVLVEIAITLAKAGLWEKAEEITLKTGYALSPSGSEASEAYQNTRCAIEQAKTEKIVATITPLVQAGSFQKALAFARGLKDRHSKIFALTRTADAMKQAGLPGEEVSRVVEEASAIIREIGTAYEKSTTPANQSVQVITANVEYWSVNFYALASAAIALAQAGLFDQALVLIREIGYGWRISFALTETAIILAETKMEREIKYNLFCEMLAVVRDKLSYSIPRKIAPPFPQTKILLKRMVDFLDETTQLSSEAAPALNRILTAMVQAGFSDQAIVIAREAEDKCSKSSPLCAVALAMTHAGMPMDRIESIFEDALTLSNKKDDVNYHPEKFIHIIKSMIEAGFIEEALPIARGLKDYERSLVLMAIIKAMVKIKAFEEALSVATEIKSSFHKFSVLKDIATVMSQAGMPEEKVVGVFEQALSIDIKFSSSDLFLLKEMATAIAEANIKKGEKSRLFNKMSILTSKTHNIYQSDAKAIVAVAMAQAGLFEEAFAVTGEIVGWHAIPRALSGIAAAIAKAEIEKEEKIKLFKRGVAVAKNIKIEYKLRSLANSLAGIAAAMAQAGLPMKEVHSIFEEALIAANKADASPPPVENILIKMGEAGHINQAIRLMNKIKNRSVRAKKIVRLVIAINGDQPPQTDSNMIKSQLHTRIYAVLGMAEE